MSIFRSYFLRTVYFYFVLFNFRYSSSVENLSIYIYCCCSLVYSSTHTCIYFDFDYSKFDSFCCHIHFCSLDASTLAHPLAYVLCVFCFYHRFFVPRCSEYIHIHKGKSSRACTSNASIFSWRKKQLTLNSIPNTHQIERLLLYFLINVF